MAFKNIPPLLLAICTTLQGVTAVTTPLSTITSRDVAVNETFIATEAPQGNIFTQLSEDEDEAVRTFLSSLQNTSAAVGNFTKVWSLNTLPPNKTSAVAYLDGKGPKPPRYAQATLRFDCYIQEWMVGPLPIGKDATAEPLDYMYKGNSKMQFPNCVQRDPFEGLTSPNETLAWNGKKLRHDDLTAPLAVAPDGARYGFDPKENYVSWIELTHFALDFSFLVAMGHTGVGLYDVRFQGQRIIYEAVLQEALSHYAGVDQLASETVYLDTMLKWAPGKLIPGFDCPSYATYTDSFCLFEYPKDFPLQRHADSYHHATKNIAFILRSVVVIGNYDYQMTFEFGLDGSIQVLARASGYIAWAPWNDTAADLDYGFKVRDGWSGSIHDHLLNYKLDIDVNGVANSLYKTEFKPLERSVPWSNDTINTMKVERSFISNEDQGRINWSPNSAASYAVVNKDTPNQYGEYPGFKIYPSTGASISLTAHNSTILSNAGHWTTHPLYAIKRKDSEPTATYVWSYYNIHEPLVDFDTYFDGESLDQEDIVLYFNLGMHHLPDTYDMPNTMFSGAQSGITIRPQNYGDSNPSLATRQMVDVSEDGKTVEMYGQKTPSGMFNLAAMNSDIGSMMAEAS